MVPIKLLPASPKHRRVRKRRQHLRRHKSMLPQPHLRELWLLWHVLRQLWHQLHVLQPVLRRPPVQQRQVREALQDNLLVLKGLLQPPGVRVGRLQGPLQERRLQLLHLH